MGHKIFKTQKQYIRYIRWRHRVTQIMTIVSVLLLLLHIILVNPYSIAAWLVFTTYLVFTIILNHCAKQEYLRTDTEAAKKDAQERFAKENKMRLRK